MAAATTHTHNHEGSTAAGKGPTMSTFSVTTTFCADGAEALARVERRLPEGFATTGRTTVKSARHMLVDVEVEAQPGADRNDCWVMLTSFGMNPSDDLGSVWQTVAGVGRFD